MMLRQFFGSMDPAYLLCLALIGVILVFGVLGTVYENWRR